ncbi:MAG: type 1 periplasmic binding fold superfamily protein [Crocinitomicaceae bacterium]|nr:type 1 periplasmic binding fold superfamily protein [Crocinitomicaceae bacterium]
MLILMSVSSCKKDEPKDPVIPNEEEVITTLHYTLTPNNGGAPVKLTFQDLDGDGGNPPTISKGVLDANTTYLGSLELLNEIESPAKSLTKEIEEEADEHQFFFNTTVKDLSISYADKDANSKPIGLVTSLSTKGRATGKITIILKHEPNKNASGVSDGIIDNAGGETDIEVSFDIEVR